MAVFKRAGSKIFGVQLNKAEQKAMNEEITRQILEHDEAFSVDLDSTILYVLHEQFGFGKVRLQRFYDLFLKRHQELRDYYQFDSSDVSWFCRMKLKEECDVDVEQWYKNSKNDT